MKAALKVGLSLVAVLGFLALAQADDKKEETLKGTITCAKCDLDIAKDGKCHTVIKVKDNVYWFAKDSKNPHKQICKQAKEGTVTGVVSEKDGKKWIKATKVEFDK